MLRESASANIRFPATCARCGGHVAEQVAFCPHCGTHARLAFASDNSPPRTSAASKTRDDPRGEPRWSSPPRPLFASAAGGNAYANLPPPPEIAEGGRHWGIKAGTALTLAVFVALYGSIVLVHRYNDASSRIQQSTLRTVEGTVQANATSAAGQPINKRNAAKAPSTSPPATVSSVTPAPASAPAPTQRASTSAPASTPTADSVGSTTTYASPDSNVTPEQHARAPSSQAVAPVTVPSIAGRSTSSGTSSSKTAARESEKAITSKPTRHPNVANTSAVASLASTSTSTSAQKALEQRRSASVARSIAIAQASLEKNNLSAARRALSEAQSAQPGNSEAFMLQQDLVSRERARDSALSAARICAVQQQWSCAWHQAGAALAADAGSVEAKALVQRSIVESGAATRPAGPGPDGPDVPLLAQ
ncbi:hypothetical protein LJR230_003878 [Trinickia sp. LjRoot230]|uniref:hypothetical protein n=1 Tax=Trinickia sp. LjRoot230 TaxID=3342288 RepID=UPI003ECCBACA